MLKRSFQNWQNKAFKRLSDNKRILSHIEIEHLLIKKKTDSLFPFSLSQKTMDKRLLSAFYRLLKFYTKKRALLLWSVLF